MRSAARVELALTTVVYLLANFVRLEELTLYSNVGCPPEVNVVEKNNDVFLPPRVTESVPPRLFPCGVTYHFVQSTCG